MKKPVFLLKRDNKPYISELQTSELRLNNALTALREFIPNPDMSDLQDIMTGGDRVKEMLERRQEKRLAELSMPRDREIQRSENSHTMSRLVSYCIFAAQDHKTGLNKIDFIPDSCIELIEGIVAYNDEAYAMIDERCIENIETEAQQTVYNLSMQLADVLNRLRLYTSAEAYSNTLATVVLEGNSYIVNNEFIANLK